MPEFSDVELHRRGIATMIAAWEAYARGASGAEVLRAPGVIAAVFPHEPERLFYNNALLSAESTTDSRSAALDAMAAAYAGANVQHYAAWAQEGDLGMRDELTRRGYTFETSTRAMGLALSGLAHPRPDADVGTIEWDVYVQQFGMPSGFLAGLEHDRFYLQVAYLNGHAVAATLAFDDDGDCGIYNVETLEHARRRGLATALTLTQLHDALARGCQTASLQATPEAERLYAAIGFRDLGRIFEYVP